jgi:hypothetical protein
MENVCTNTPTRAPRSSKKAAFADTPSRLFTTTPRAAKLKQEGIKLREQAAKKQAALSSARKLSLEARREEEAARKAVDAELVSSRLAGRKELANNAKAAEKKNRKRKAEADALDHTQERSQKRSSAATKRQEREDRLASQVEHHKHVATLEKAKKAQKKELMAFHRQEQARHKKLASDELNTLAETEAEEQDIKQAEAADVVNYKSQMKKGRRDSMAFRRQEHKEHKKLAADAKTLEREVATEAAEIALQDRDDVKEHHIRQKQARRQSVHTRREYAKLQVLLTDCTINRGSTVPSCRYHNQPHRIHALTPTHTHAHPRTPTHTHAHPRTHVC